MTFTALVSPLVAALVLAIAFTAVHRKLPPTIAARLIAITLAAVLVAAVPTLWVVSVAFITHLPALGGRLHWCAEAFGVHQPVPTWAGLLLITVTIGGAVRAGGVLRTNRRLRHDAAGAVEIAEHSRPLAFTLPGRAGRVVVSTALLDLLDEHEREVVLAHEGAHGRFRHDRYLLAAQLAEAVVPVVRPLARRLQFTLERWADEAAVDHCGDRAFVARTLGKVALNTVSPAGALSFAGLGVTARVAALLSPPRQPPHWLAGAGLWIVFAATASMALYQIHHLGLLVVALCPG